MGEEYYNDMWEFEWNNQKVNVRCLCGEMIEVLSDGAETCPKCGRIYWLETVVKVDWAMNADSEDNLLLSNI